MFPNWLKGIVKRSPWMVALHSRLRWRLHLLVDWWGTRVWTRTREQVTPMGFKLTSGLHPAYELMRRGEFEPLETALVGRLLGDTDRFVDIGANLGYYTCLALQRGVRVVAFEPQPRNLQSLYANINANGWQQLAEVFPLALSECAGLLTLYGASGPSASLVRGWAGYSSRFRQVVPVSTLDNVIAGRFAGERLLIKIDVEGAEYPVLRGALGTLARRPAPAWLLEICLEEFHPDGANPDYLEIFRLFWSNGYRAFAIADPVRALEVVEVEQWWAERHAGAGTFNYLFLAEDRELPPAV